MQAQEQPAKEVSTESGNVQTDADEKLKGLLSNSEIRGDEVRVQTQEPPAKEVSIESANVQTDVDEKLEVL
jgi:hypothetical protein